MKKVFVKGLVEDYSADNLKKMGHHSLPVRFKLENGGYEWIWVRKNNVSLCRAEKPRRTGGR